MPKTTWLEFGRYSSLIVRVLELQARSPNAQNGAAAELVVSPLPLPLRSLHKAGERVSHGRTTCLTLHYYFPGVPRT